MPQDTPEEGNPELVAKAAALRGAVGDVRFVADQPGTFAVHFTVYCGFGHDVMRVEDALVVNP